LRVHQGVLLASPAESSVAVGLSSCSGVQAALVVGRQALDVDEGVALKDASGLGISTFECVPVVVLPYVVDGVEQSSSGQGGRTSGCVGDVVVLHGDLIIGSDHLKSPVVIAVATSSGVRRLAVDVVAGECDALARVEAEDIVLAAGTSSLMMIVSEGS